MTRSTSSLLGLGLVFCLLLFATSGLADRMQRPELVQSKRTACYARSSYQELAEKWRAYHQQLPSAEAYGNWMRAARYAGDPEYLPLLAEGLARYSDDPMLLYLTGERRHGAHDDSTGRRYLERAAAADPSFLEPWFSLVSHYLDQEDDEKLGQALKHLLDGDAIQAEVMEYSYNMLAGLAKNAILITNGDNDTY
ncbi:MAG: hypothetical protein ABIF77_02920, partial [bacterium]